MTTLLIAFLLLVTTSLIAFNRMKASLFACLITFIFFLITGFGVLSAALIKNLIPTSFLLTQPNWGKTNAIVILGAGTVKLPIQDSVKPTLLSYSRISEATRLYLSCRKTASICKIIISGGDALATGKSEAAVYQDEFLGLGVASSDVILEANSMNTFRNAELTSDILRSKHFDNVILVTSGIHMKRSLLYFSHFGIHATPAMSDYVAASISRIPLGYNFAMTDFALHEYMGIFRFYIYNYFGWNAGSRMVGAY